MTRASRSHTKPFTAAGKAYLAALTAWLQDTRLLSEAAYRLESDYKQTRKLEFSQKSWPKPSVAGSPAVKEFAIKEPGLGQHANRLLETLWADRFVVLETLWEEYLEELAKELRHRDAKLFEPFVERDLMAAIIRDVITGRVTSVDAIKDEVATRFATSLTRQSWDEQWKQLNRLEIGLSEKDKALPWYPKLDAYFEMRNCIIHRATRVSQALRQKGDPYFEDLTVLMVRIYPPQLDFYRSQFLECLFHIEAKFEAKFKQGSAHRVTA